MAEGGEEDVKPQEGTDAFLLSDGSKYDGEWILVNGVRQRHGHGLHIDGIVRGQSYQGEWQNDQMHGRGIFRYSSNAKYEGEFANNVYSGTGKYTFPDGAFYEGSFAQGQMHGSGSLTDAQGVVWEGNFYMGTGPGLPGTATTITP
eukprot:scaffold6762_cov146-Isochrysis_galbana.AAC.1